MMVLLVKYQRSYIVLVDEFRKTWIKNFSNDEMDRYQNAVDANGDVCLFIMRDVAYDMNDSLMPHCSSVHYTGSGFLDVFWNTLLELNVDDLKTPEQKKREKKKSPTKRKYTRKKKEVKPVEPTKPKRKYTRKKKIEPVEQPPIEQPKAKRKYTRRSKPKSLVEF